MAEADLGGLRAGDDHFMAYVGPPGQYDLMAATQFSLLAAMGLRSRHKVLDIGCGSLRVGRLLIPYLDAGHYCGVEPNEWLVHEGIAAHLGPSVLEVKRPRFAFNSDFDASEFETTFDVVLAQSILSHTGRDMAVDALRSFASVLSERGRALVTFGETAEQLPADAPRPEGWVYPGIVRFHPDEVIAMGREAGLCAARLQWFHPRQAWYAFAHDESALPRPVAREQRGYMSSWPKAAGGRAGKRKRSLPKA